MTKSERKFVQWSVLRQMPLSAGLFMLLSSLVIVASTLFPIQMSATARLMENMPSVVQSSGASDARTAGPAHLQRIRNRVTTHARLSALLETLKSDLTTQEFLDATDIEILSGRDNPTLMAITVSAANADFAAKAANALAELVLTEHRKMSSESTMENMRFFRDEVSTAKAKLDQEFAALLAFKQVNAGALPENENVYLDMRKLLSQQEVATSTRPSLQPSRDRLARELSEARALFANDHPTVRALASRFNSTQTIDPDGRDELSVIKTQLAEVDQRLSEIPSNGLTLDALQRDHDLAEAQYKSAVERYEIAAAQERLSFRENGSQLAVVELATPPALPEGPRQKIILATGIAISFLFALGLAVLRTRMDLLIRRPRDIETKLQIRPYAVIPQMHAA